jgi:hypothetical protein
MTPIAIVALLGLAGIVSLLPPITAPVRAGDSDEIFTLGGEVVVFSGSITAENYKKLSENSRLVYAIGFMSGLWSSMPLGANFQRLSNLGKCVEGWSESQIMAVFDKYLQDHPEEWHFPMNFLCISALHSACKGTQNAPSDPPKKKSGSKK